MTRALAATLLAALVLIPAAGTHGIKEGGTFRVGWPGLTSIDPLISGSLVTRLTCGGLMTLPSKPLPEGLEPVPEIAADYPKVTNGGQTYTFMIRKRVRFSNGRPVTARSVAHTINRLLNPMMQSPLGNATVYSDIVGAQRVIDGKAETASGVLARGDRLIIRLKRPLFDYAERLTERLCVVPETTPIDPEGVKARAPAAGPYYVSAYVPNEQLVLERNPFYRGFRLARVDRFVVDITLDPGGARTLDRVDRGEFDYGGVNNQSYGDRALEFRRKYGINKSRFWSAPDRSLRTFVLNTGGPLFRKNPRLRQAVNFAVDRKALLRERGPLAGTLTDQYLPPGVPGFRDEKIYPLKGPDLTMARALAKSHRRSGKAVLYTIANPTGLAQAQIVKSNLREIGLDVEIKSFPTGQLLFGKLATPGEPFDIGLLGLVNDSVDHSAFGRFFDGRTIGQSGSINYSYFDSPKYTRLLEEASRLPLGPERYRSYGELDVAIARNAAPVVAYANDRALTLVGPRTGCVVLNPYLDLTAVCLKK